ncbi:hypothetical protein ACFWWM_37240 [Streptomyces sp. NPDC058682]|uniref:hypothetical protein n=1 Tax=Streptomyces sp. NPDC058682 TaxID=3346596 RepID=UPI0036638054
MHQQKIRYVLAVPVTLPVQGRRASRTCRRSRRPEICCTTPRYAGSGSAAARARAPRQQSYDWAWFEVTLPGQVPAVGFAHQLLIRRSTGKKQLTNGRLDFENAYFLVHAPADDPVTEAFVRAGVRWKIEENNELAKQITGLGRCQVRRWTA